jgi:sugar lactone lactonase YvrE
MTNQNQTVSDKRNSVVKNLTNFVYDYRKTFFICMAFGLIMCQPKQEIQFPVKVGERPESITKGFKGNYYVTVMNGKETGDGGVAEISENGVKTFFKGGDEPKGIVYIKDHLYFSDVTRIWKVDQEGHGEVFVDKEGFPEEVLYLNDVAVDAKGTGIYVTDMGATQYMRDENNNLWPLDSEQAKLVPPLGRIYHVDLMGQVTIVQDTSRLMLNPNGVGVDNNGDIMVGAFFLGNFLVNKNGQLAPLKGQFRGADAVEQDSKGDYYVSSWSAGTVWKIDGQTEEATVLIDGLKSAADFYLEEDKGRLLLPDMLEGVIYSVDIKR